MTSLAEKAAAFRSMLDSDELEFLMEAHNGLSARIAERAGFRGIWASGLSMSAAMGVRDNNEASWTQVLEILEFMADATSVPIMMDGDTGFGNFNNMRRLVRKLCQKGVAAVCIEDKLFPKTNSFLGEAQPLADIDEFCGKIKAGKDSQLDDSFSVVARVEALISGWGIDEALRRAERYHAAGADGILIHSKQSHAGEIIDFMKAWDGRCPVVIVPTMYYATPTDEFRAAGISMVIWANQVLRAAIAGMQSTAEHLFREQSLIDIEDSLPTVKDVFDLQENQELVEAEERYLPSGGRRVSGVVLATSRGTPLGELTADKPKCMVDVRGKPLLSHLTKLLGDAGVSPINVVRGYRKDAINLEGPAYIDNDDFAETGELGSLDLAAARLNDEAIVMYGDVLFRRFILDELMSCDADIALVVDGRKPATNGGMADLAICSAPPSGDGVIPDTERVSLRAVGRNVPAADAHGEWIGLLRLGTAGAQKFTAAVHAVREQLGREARIPDVLNHLVDQGEDIGVVYISGYWIDVDTVSDLAEIQQF